MKIGLLIAKFVSWTYILLKVLANFLRLPLYLLKDSSTFIHHYLHDFVDGIINMELQFSDRIECIDLFRLQQLLGGPPPSLQLTFENKYGNINFLESVVISYLVQSLRPKTLFEIGTFDGFSTLHLAKNTPKDAVVHTLNLPPTSSLEDYNSVYSLLEYHEDTKTHEILKKNGVGTLYRNSDVAPKIHQLFGNSLTYDFSPYTGKVDLCFVDGGHTSLHMQSDTANALKMLSPTGIIIWHDYNVQHRDIYRFLNDFACDHKIYHIRGTRLAVYFKNLDSRAPEPTTT